LISGYSSMRVFTYSNSLSMISRTASLVEDLELDFDREDIELPSIGIKGARKTGTKCSIIRGVL
jgi:hypothetical protein